MTAAGMVELVDGGAADIAAVDAVMAAAFDPRFGEAWTRSQCLGVLSLPGIWLTLARMGGATAGFTLSRMILDEAELLLLAVAPAHRRCGIGGALLRAMVAEAGGRGGARVHLEVRAGNPATRLYAASGFAQVGVRRGYYRGRGGGTFDALSYSKLIPQ